ncbi:unnamed protein product [Linum trigynum]|uniref:Uncharacterized protein n=1 Tax=Linum trigynum TaxID=586398 RepID=A0AAV2E987_9ROSI
MEAFQKELDDIKGELREFNKKLVGFDVKLTGFDEMQGKEVATNEEEIVFDDDDHYEPPRGHASGSKFVLISSKNTGDKGNIGPLKHDN